VVLTVLIDAGLVVELADAMTAMDVFHLFRQDSRDYQRFRAQTFATMLIVVVMVLSVSDSFKMVQYKTYKRRI
jgi:hypothetical protein